MKALLDYIEKYVEWLVLALAVLWLGWLAVDYWVEQPVTVSLQNAGGQSKDVAPEEVDAWTQNNLVPKAQEAMNAPSHEKSKSLEFLSYFTSELTSPVEAPGTAYTLNVPTSSNGELTSSSTPSTLPVENVAGLAQAVPPQLIGASYGKTVVLWPQPATAPATGAIANGQGGVGAPPPAVQTVPTDVVWITLDAKYLAATQYQAYLDARIPKFLLTSVPILRVTLQRQRMNDDETWPEKWDVVADQFNNPFGDFGAKIPPKFPADGDAAADRNYIAYVSDHEPLIVEPPFYALAPAPSGDVWWTALAGNPNANRVLPVAMPAPPATPPPPPNTPRPTNPNNNPNNNTPPSVPPPGQNRQPTNPGQHRGGRGSSARYTPAPSNGGGQGSAAPSAEQNYGPGHRADGTNVPPAPPPASPPPGNPQINPYVAGVGPISTPGNPAFNANAGPQPNALPKLASPPDKVLDPAKQNDFEIWAHDIGIVGTPGGPQPGCTYRYRMEIRILNPLYTFAQVCKNPKDAAVYDLVTTTAWSDPLIIPRLRYFYVADNAMGDGVRIELYEWKGGRWTMQSLPKLHPGDAIGDTGATVVDLRMDWRPDADGKIVLIADADGKLEARTLKGDSNNHEHVKLRQEAFVVQASVSSAAPTGGIGR